VAAGSPKTTLRWQAAKLKFAEREANAFVRRKYRKGWNVRGLS